MKCRIIIFLLAGLAFIASGQTSSVDPRAEQLERRIEDQIKREPTVPIQLTPEESALLVKEAVLPPINQQDVSADTNAVQMVSFRMRNVPVAFAAKAYAEYTGKNVTVQDGLNESITVHTTGTVTRAQAAALMEKAFSAQGLSVVDTDIKAVRIEKK